MHVCTSRDVDPNEMMIKCPGCLLELHVDDLQEQSAHMTEHHPEIIEARRAAAARWDGWEQD